MITFYMLLVTMASFAVEEFHASTAQAGLISGIYIVGALIGRLVTGRFIDHADQKKILLFGLFLFTVTLASYMIVNGITMLVFVRLANGIAAGVASTATNTIVAQVVPDDKKGEGISYFSLSTTIGTALGPFFGLYLEQHLSYTIIFMIFVIVSFCTLVFALFTKFKQLHFEQTAESRGIHLAQFIDKKALPISLLMLFLSLGNAGIMSFIKFFAEERQLVSATSFFFMIFAIAILMTRPFTGKLMDVKGANVVMYPCIVLYGVGLLLLSISHNAWYLFVAAAIIGIGYGNITSITQALAIKVTTPDHMGLATSTYYIGLNIGLGFGPYFLGHLVPMLGYGQLYAWLGVSMLLCIVFYFVIYGRKEKLLAYSNSDK